MLELRVEKMPGHPVDCPDRYGNCTAVDRLIGIGDHYRAGDKSPLAFGRMVLACVTETRITMQSLARLTSITAGTLHHYVSLVQDLAPELQTALERKQLNFKEARALADIDGHERQMVAARPFLAGELSSVVIERVVGLMRQHSEVPAERALELAIQALPLKRKTLPGQPPRVIIERPNCDPDQLVGDVLKLAGALDVFRQTEVPEYRRLRVLQSVRLLHERTARLVGAPVMG